MQAGSTLTVNQGSTLLCDGYISLTGSHAQLNGTSNATINLDSSCISNNSGTTNYNSNAIVNLNNTSSLNIQSSASSNIYGSIFIYAGGSITNFGTYLSDSFNKFITTQTRNMVTNVINGQIAAGSWAIQPYGYSDTTSSITSTLPILYVPINRMHNGANLLTVTVYFQVGLNHSTAPATPPTIKVVSVASNGTSSTLLNNTTNATYSGVWYNASGAACFFNPSSAPTGAAYYNSGAVQSITFTCNQNNTIDNTANSYCVIITDESGSNSLNGNTFYNIVCNFGNITTQSWNI
jgi:hypothetical protein